MTWRVANQTRNTVLAERAHEASSFGARLRGLMGRPALPAGEGLHLVPCKAVHMLFMRFPIDALFLDRERRVVKVLSLFPWDISASYTRAHSVLELPKGTAEASGTREGDQLRFEPISEGF